MKHVILLIVASIFFNSCIVLNSGNISSGPLLSSKDGYIDRASGESECMFIFGLGNLNRDKLLSEAKTNMYLNRPLNSNEYYSNLTCDISKKIMFGIIFFTKVTVSADVMKSTYADTLVFSEAFRKKITPFVDTKTKLKTLTQTNAETGDTLYFSLNDNNYQVYVASFADKKTVILIPQFPEGQNILVSNQSNLFFFKTKLNREFMQGQIVKGEARDSFDNSIVAYEYKLLGFSKELVLLKTADGFMTLPFEKIQKK